MFSNTNHFRGPESSQRARAAATQDHICAATHGPPGVAEDVSGDCEHTAEMLPSVAWGRVGVQNYSAT